MEQKKSNKGLIILVIIFGVIILGLSGFIVYDKLIKRENNKPTTEKDNNSNKSEDNNAEKKEEDNKTEEIKTYDKINYRIEKYTFDGDEWTNLYINEKLFQYPASEGRNYYASVEQLADILIVKVGTVTDLSIYVVNSNGEAIGSFQWAPSSYENLKYTYVTIGYPTGVYSIEGNTITMETEDLFQDPKYIACNAEPDRIVKAKEKFTYLGNGEFSKSEMLEKTTAKEYIEQNNWDCSN
mgnify:CR=1 FL=1